MELIVISYPEVFPNEKQLINLLFQNGMSRFHLRKPNWSCEQITQLLDEIPCKFYAGIVLHDHFELAKKYKLGGIHFTGKTKQYISEHRDFDGIQSTSCHSLEELQSLSPQIDYAFLSPIFPSISKKGYAGNWDFQQIISLLKQKRNYKTIALGGVSERNTEECASLGFDGIAILGALWKPELSDQTIIERFLQISNTCKKNVHM